MDQADRARRPDSAAATAGPGAVRSGPTASGCGPAPARTASGRLDPSHAAIARKANVCERTVATSLKRLRELGILNWVRRCAQSWQDGRFVLEQDTNAYAVLPATQWRGYRPPAEPPAPAPGTWGTPMPDVRLQAALEARQGSNLRSVVQVLEYDPKDKLAAALARLGRAFMARDS